MSTSTSKTESKSKANGATAPLPIRQQGADVSAVFGAARRVARWLRR
jgi:hypothetical protein